MVEKKKVRGAERVLIKCGIIVLLVGITALFIYGLQLKSALRQGFSEAKNIELAFRLMAVEYFDADRVIYDPLEPDGLVTGVSEEVKKLSGAEGDVMLISWDAARQAAGSFIYNTGNIIIVYRYDKNSAHACWNVYYHLYEIGI